MKKFETHDKIIAHLTLLIISLFLVLCSCSPAKKLERFQKRYPNYLEKVTDTLIFTDTLFDTIPGSTYDTNFHESSLKDTVVIENGIVKTIIYKNYDTIYVSNEVDTIFREIIREIKVPYQAYTVEGKNNNHFYIIISLLIILAIIILFIVRRIKKPP